jgi:Tfp pilus assembly protein PilV
MIGTELAAQLQRAVRSRRQRSRSEAGFSLVEILVCVVLMSTVILALASGMLTLVRTTGSTSERQQIQLALGSFTESLKTTPPYVICRDAAEYEADYAAAADSWKPDPARNIDLEVTGVEYWDRNATAASNTVAGAFAVNCPPGENGPQRLTVKVTLPSGRSGTAQVVKSVLA